MGYFKDTVMLGVKTAEYNLADDLQYAHRDSDLHQALFDRSLKEHQARIRQEAIHNTLRGASHGMRAGGLYADFDEDDRDEYGESRRRRNIAHGVGAGLGALTGAASSYMDYQNAAEHAHSDVDDIVSEGQRALELARARHGDSYDVNKDLTLGNRSQLHDAYRQAVRDEMGYGPSYGGIIGGGALGGMLGAIPGALGNSGVAAGVGGLGGMLLGGYLGNKAGKGMRDPESREIAGDLVKNLQYGNSGARARQGKKKE